MAANNPFSPFAATNPAGAPQIQGIQMPNVPMQGEQPGLMQQVGPKVLEKAIFSDEAGATKDWGFGKVKEAWSAFNPVSPDVIPVSELSNTMGTAISPSAMLGGGAEGAIAAQQAATASAMPAHLALGAETAAAATAAAAGTTAATTAASVAPAALAAGPLAPLVMLGAGLMAAGGGK